jgi:hypothetical protein
MMTAMDDLAQVRAEGELLHQSIFGSPIPEPVLEKYIEAHKYYLTSAEESELCWMAKVVRLGLDLEALEIALRLSDKGHLLVRKFKILVHITEAFDTYRSCFINEHPRRLGAIAILAFHFFRTASKFLKGKLLLWRLKRLV